MMERFKNNPWPGLASYEDPLVCGNRYIFCGRDSEVYDVVRLIDDNFFVTLYGKSGIGKSSLLKAGVFPYIRKDQYLPLMLRLGLVEESDCFQQILISSIEKEIAEQKGYVETIDVVSEDKDTEAVEYLWNYFARHRFYDERGEIVFPVIVLDQFEEVFRKRHLRKKTKLLLAQINYLIDENHALGDCLVNGKEYYYDFNFRFIISIREDELYRLEETLDNNYLPALKNFRYRLKSLTEQGAKDVVLIPGKGMFIEQEEPSIVDTIIDSARNESADGYSTNVLSLVCNRIYEEASKQGTWPLSLAKVREFLEGNPFERFYYEATEGLPAKERHYIEDNLIDSAGRRNAITEEDFIKNVPHGSELLKEGPRKILQRVSVSSDAERPRIELIHDSFCAPLAELKHKRRQSRELRFTAVVLFSLFAILAIALWINARLQTTNSLLKAQSRAISETVLDLVNEGDLGEAAVLAMEINPREVSRPNRPYTPEAERAIRAVGNRVLPQERQIHPGDNVTAIAISPDNRFVYAVVENNKVLEYELIHGESHNKGHFIKTIQLYDSLSLRSSCPVAISSNKTSVIIATGEENGDIRIWDAHEQNQVGILQGHKASITSLVFSENGVKLTSISRDNTVRYWDVAGKQEKQIDTIGTNLHLRYAEISSDGSRLFGIDTSSVFYVWDCQQQGEPIEYNDPYQYLPSPLSAAIAHDGKTIYVTLTDQSVHEIVDGAFHFSESEEVSKAIKSRRDESIHNKQYRVFAHQIDSISSRWDHGRYFEVEESAISENGKLLAYILRGTNDTGMLYMINDSGIKSIDIPQIESWWGGLVVSPLGNMAAVHDRGIVRFVDIDKGAIVDSVSFLSSYKGAFNYKGEHYFSLTEENHVAIWDINKHTQIDTLVGTTCAQTLLRFSPNGRFLVSTGSDAIMNIWDGKSYKKKYNLQGYSTEVVDLSFNLDGDVLLSTHSDGTIEKWDLRLGKLIDIYKCEVPIIQFFRIGHNNIYTYGYNDNTAYLSDYRYVQHLTFPFGDGKKVNNIYCSDSDEEFKDVRSDCHTGFISAVAFLPRKNIFITGAYDNTLKIWDIETGTLLNELIGHNAPIASIERSYDEKYLISSDTDGTIYIWYYPDLQELINVFRNRYDYRVQILDTSPLSEKRRIRYFLQ